MGDSYLFGKRVSVGQFVGNVGRAMLMKGSTQ